MVYINKKLQQLIVDMDNQFSISLGVRKWVKTSIYPKHNLIIKSKSGCYCTNCKKKFYSNAKIHEYTTCPRCKEKLEVRKCNLQYYVFLDDFRVLDYIDGCFVIRGFEVRSTYSNYKVSHHIVEYKRLVIDKDNKYLLLSNVFKIFLMSAGVSHDEKHIKWRLYNKYHSYYYYPGGSLYWGEVAGDIDGSIYQYCPIERVLSTYTGNDIEEVLQRVLKAPIPFELLSKLNLTNLAIQCDKFNNKGSFETRFGVGKEYLPFMVKHNITIKELEVLKVIKRKNIRIIRKLSELNFFNELAEYLDIIKALENGLNKNTEDIYRDYLDMAERLKLNLKDKQVLYPKNLNESHDKLLSQIEDIKNKEIVEKIKQRYEELKDNTYQNEKYIVYPVPTVADLVAESSMQNNCVRTYNERYANKEVDLYLMRLLSKQNKSLVTIEVRDNKVVQSRIKNNNNCTKEQLAFINKWQDIVLKGSGKYA